MALTVYTSKDNQWREYVNPLRGLTLERIVSLIEQGERGVFSGAGVVVFSCACRLQANGLPVSTSSALRG